MNSWSFDSNTRCYFCGKKIITLEELETHLNSVVIKILVKSGKVDNTFFNRIYLEINNLKENENNQSKGRKY